MRKRSKELLKNNNEPCHREQPGEAIALAIDFTKISRRLLFACIFFILLLFCLDYLFTYLDLASKSQIRDLFDITSESSIGSWFMNIQTFLAGLTLGAIFWATRILNLPRKTTLCWLALCLFFVWMSMDDGAQIHERLSGAFFSLLRGKGGGAVPAWIGRLFVGFPSYIWPLLFLPLFGGMGLLLLVFVWLKLCWAPKLRWVLVGALACMGTAVALDFFQGLGLNTPWNPYLLIMQRTGLGHLTVFHFGPAVEESLEMIGMSLLWYVFFRHLGRVISGGVSLVPSLAMSQSESMDQS